MHQRTYLFILLACLLTIKVAAQVDPHFSQYFAYPLFLNPALTGVSDGDTRATVIYRNQWSALGKPFITTGISGDMSTNKNISLGVNVLNHTAGNGGYKLTTANISIAYSGIQLDYDGFQRIVFGLQAGLINRRIDPSKLEFGDQWLPYVGYNSSVATAEVFSRSRALQFDAGAGISYYDSRPEQAVNFFSGFSATHLTQPEDPFLKGEKGTMPVRYAFNAGARFELSYNSYLVANTIFMRQGNAEEKMLGGYLQTIVDDNVELLTGVNYRYEDAIVPFVGLNFNRFVLGLSYDINISQLSTKAGRANSFELSLTINGPRTNKSNYFKCPVF